MLVVMTTVELRVPARRIATGTTPQVFAALATLSAGLCALTALLVLSAPWPPAELFGRAVLHVLVVGVPMAAGLYAIRSSRTRRFGYLLLATGALWSVTALAETDASVPYSIGRVTAWLVFPVLIYLMLAFPRGRLAAGPDRWLFGGITVLVAVLFVGAAPFVESYPTPSPWTACRADCPSNAFFVLASEPAVIADLLEPVREILAVVLLVGVTLSLANRMRTATPLVRRTIGPVVATSIAAVVILVLFILTRRAGFGSTAVDVTAVLWSLCIPAIATAFLIGLIRRRLMIAGALGQLSVRLSAPLHRDELGPVLASALGDPTLDVLFSDEDRGAWPSSAMARSGVVMTEIRDNGAPVAAIVHDAALAEDDELLEAVASQSLAALRHTQLNTRLEASRAQLEASRNRVNAAADAERRRIERDLHDGAQQRLVTLRIRLTLAEELMHTNAPAGTKAMHELGDQIDLALEELRTLAHGIYPAVLADRGLAAAVRSAARESTLSIRVDAHGVTRHPPEIESAAYFTCLEALQNAAKHAQAATGVWLTLRQDDALNLEVRDDGPGFEPQANLETGGLRNMTDRLEAVGGRLAILSSPGQGTRIIGTIPLASDTQR
jgi:signal transduction histidine kinase